MNIARLHVPIQSEQDLLCRYVLAEKTAISEYSGDFEGDTAALYRGVRDYAERYDLKVDPEWFSAFLRDYPQVES